MFKKTLLVTLSVFLMLVIFVGGANAADADDLQWAMNGTDECSTFQLSSAGSDSGLEQESDNILSQNSLNVGNNIITSQNNNPISSVNSVSPFEVIGGGGKQYNDLSVNLVIAKPKNQLSDILLNVNNEDILGDSVDFSGTTFSELQTLINNCHDGDTINLLGNITQDGTSHILINKSLIINGNGFTVDAQGKSRIFFIKSNKTTLNNIVFINGYIYELGNGAAILLKGNDYIITNCTFRNNTINVRGNGGAICCRDATGRISNCNFIENTAYWDGGAINWNNCSNSVISDCNFTHNYAGSYSGAIHSENGYNVNISNCNFINNFAVSYSGAISWNGYNATISGCNFTNNTANGWGGGAITVNGLNNVVSKGNFVNNTCSLYGGAIYWYSSDGKVSDCSFINNTAAEGGAIELYSGTNFTISNCNFTNNNAYYNGGAINFGDQTSYIGDTFVIKCNFINNTCSNYGGDINGYSEFGTIEDCNFTNSNASVGGAISLFNRADVSNCNFINGTAATIGGAIYFYNILANVSDCSFTDNNAVEGGAICSQNGEVNIFGCNFTDNNASDGGAIRLQGGTMSIDVCSFENNTAVEDGGAICLESGEATGEYQGQIIPLTGPAGNFSISSSSFVNNNAGNGGAISSIFNTTSFLESLLGDRYEMLVSLGVIFNVTPGFTNTVISSSFVNNSARDFKGDGGAVYWLGKGNFSGSSFVNNSARAGGAIYWLGSGSVSDSYFIDNKVLSTDLYGNKENLLLYLTFEGNENYTNAIFINGAVDFDNVTYWNGSVVNSDDVYPLKAIQEVGIDIALEIYDSKDNFVEIITTKTDANGQVIFDYSEYLGCHYKAYHIDDTYYTYIETVGAFDKGYDIIVLNNQTVKSFKGTEIILNAIIKDASNNTLFAGDVNLFFILPNGTRIEASCGGDGIWTAPYTFNEIGDYVISAEVIPVSFMYDGDDYTLNKVFNGTVSVLTDASLILSLISNDPNVMVGDSVSFTVVVTNDGNCDLGNVNVVINIPEGLIYTGFEGSDWSKSSSSSTGVYKLGILGANVGSSDGDKFTYSGVLKSGDSAMFTMYFNTTKAGTFTVKATANSNMTEGAYSENSTDVSENPSPNPDPETDPESDSESDSESNLESDSVEQGVNAGSNSKVMHETGNPIWLLWMAVLVFLPLRRKN